VFAVPLWLLALAPLAGLVVTWAVLRWGSWRAAPGTTDAYLEAFHDPDRPIPVREVPGKVAAAVATLGLGGAMGLEGPSLYLGAGLGAWLQRRFVAIVGPADRRLLLVAGAAAGVAAIFKAPATGAVFALEVPYQDDLARRMLLPALVSSASGYLVFAAINGTEPILPVRGSPSFSFVDLAGAALLGLAAGLGARAFAWLIRTAKRTIGTVPAVLRLPAAGAVLAACFVSGRIMTGRSIGIGAGYQTIDWALEPGHAAWVLLVILVVRCVATAATVAGGGVGGLFIPLVVAGALLGRAAGDVAGDTRTTLFVVIGVAAFLGAGYRVPLAAVMFVAETTGRPGFVVPALLAAVAAELVMSRASVTEYQFVAGGTRPDVAGPPGAPTDATPPDT
jgi:CIC family chloride channel protein